MFGFSCYWRAPMVSLLSYMFFLKLPYKYLYAKFTNSKHWSNSVRWSFSFNWTVGEVFISGWVLIDYEFCCPFRWYFLVWWCLVPMTFPMDGSTLLCYFDTELDLFMMVSFWIWILLLSCYNSSVLVVNSWLWSLFLSILLRSAVFEVFGLLKHHQMTCGG